MQNAIETTKSQTFGTEQKCTGIIRDRSVKAIQQVLGGTIRYVGAEYQTWEVVSANGRIWKAMRDGSLGIDGGCEVVTPILPGEDMDTLQEVVRALWKARAKAMMETC